MMHGSPQSQAIGARCLECSFSLCSVVQAVSAISSVLFKGSIKKLEYTYFWSVWMYILQLKKQNRIDHVMHFDWHSIMSSDSAGTVFCNVSLISSFLAIVLLWSNN